MSLNNIKIKPHQNLFGVKDTMLFVDFCGFFPDKELGPSWSLLVRPGPPRPLLRRESDGDWIKPALLVRLEKAILHRPLLPEEDRPASSNVSRGTRMKRIKAREGGRKSRIIPKLELNTPSTKQLRCGFVKKCNRLR